MQKMFDATSLLDREVLRTILQPPNPIIALLRRDLDAVITRQSEIQKNLASGLGI